MFSIEFVYLLSLSQPSPGDVKGPLYSMNATVFVGLPRDLPLNNTTALTSWKGSSFFFFLSCNLIYNLINFSYKLEHIQMVY